MEKNIFEFLDFAFYFYVTFWDTLYKRMLLTI